MSDKITFVPDNVREAVENSTDSAKNEIKKGLKETFHQIFGLSSKDKLKQEESSKKLAEKAEKSGRSIEEEAKLESLRKQLHAQVTAPRPKSPENPVEETEDKVGTNETLQPLGNSSVQTQNGLPPLAEPSMRHGERLKIRE